MIPLWRPVHYLEITSNFWLPTIRPLVALSLLWGTTTQDLQVINSVDPCVLKSNYYVGWFSFCVDFNEIWCARHSECMFLIYNNDIRDKVSSSLWLFSCDFVLYRTVTSLEDSKQLQCNLDYILQWSQLWQMNFNIRKCIVLRCYRTNSPILVNYSLAG